ncbi:MAG: tetratricopeptide repeat protein [bacterium]
MKSLHKSLLLALVLTVLVTGLISCKTVQTQDDEIPVTTASDEALKLCLEGRDKLSNIEPAAAAKLFEQAIEKDPEFALAHLYRFQCNAGGRQTRLQYLEKAVSLAENVSEGEQLLIMFEKARVDGEGQKRKETLDQLLNKFPNDKRVQYTAGNYYRNRMADNTQALQHYNRAIELDDKFAPAYNLIGYTQISLGNYEEAEKAFKKYIEVNPESPNPYDSYADFLLKMKRYDEAAEQFKMAYEKDNLYISGLAGVGDAYALKGDHEMARSYFKQVYEKAPNINGKLNSLVLTAASYIHDGNSSNALETIKKYRDLAEENKLESNIIQSYLNEGFIQTESGNPTAGLKSYQKAVELVNSPDASEDTKNTFKVNSMLNLCYATIMKGDLEKAEADLAKCQQMVQERQVPNESQLMHSVYALLESKKGNYPTALEHYGKSGADNPFDMYYKAMTYEKMGDADNAGKLHQQLQNWNVNTLTYALMQQHIKQVAKK